MPLAPDTSHRQSSAAAGEAEEVTSHSRFFETLDPQLVMGRIFDNPRFDDLGYAIWSPNYYDRRNCIVSYDDSCHTRLDTTMYWTDRQGRQCAVMLFATKKFYRDRYHNDSLMAGDCHFCGAQIGAALFSKGNGGRWKL